MTLENKSLLLNRLNLHEEAIACLKEAEALSLRHNAKDLQVDVYRNLYQFYSASKDPRLAAKYQLIYFQKKDSLLNFSKLQTVGEMHFLDQLHKVNDTVKSLSQQRTIQRAIICIILAVTVIIALFLLLLIRNYRRLQSDHRQLYRKNVETLKREEEERKRIEKYETTVAELTSAINGGKADKPRHPVTALSDDNRDTLRIRIDKVMGNVDEICATTFSLNQLAELLDMKYWNVSHAINEIYGKNFNALLNEYRIKEACRRLNDIERYGNLTIEAIAMSIGFKSRSNFVTTFKSITGLTPSEYLNMAKRSV
jgi:AraC-like DNA-binding protein